MKFSSALCIIIDSTLTLGYEELEWWRFPHIVFISFAFNKNILSDLLMLYGSPHGKQLKSNGVVLHPSKSEALLSGTDISQCLITVATSQSPDLVIDAIDVICSARHIEVFLSTGEYLTTSDGLRVDDQLRCQQKAYMVPCSFDVPVASCQLKVRFLCSLVICSMSCLATEVMKAH